MGRDVGTMTRAERRRDAHNLLLVGVCVPVVAIAAFWLGSLMHWPEAAAGVIAMASGFTMLGGILGGLYFLVRGLLRPRDWTPGRRDVATKGFSGDKEKARLAKRIRKELGASCLSVELQGRGLDAPWPEDTRTEWPHFVQSSELVHARYLLCATVRTPGREIEVHVEVGRARDDPHARSVE